MAFAKERALVNKIRTKPTLLKPTPKLSDPGPKPEQQWLPKDVFVVDRHYQRHIDSRLSQKTIARIVRDFCWARWQPPTVTPGPKGTYIVIDGQHRIAAAKQRADIDKIPVYIVPDLTIQEAAKHFYHINKTRVPLHPLQVYRAELTMGDELALRVKAVCDEAEIDICKTPAGFGETLPRQTAAIGTIKKGLEKYGEEAVLAALMIIPDAFKLTPGMMRAATLKMLMKKYKVCGVRHLNRTAMIKALKFEDPKTLEAMARKDAEEEATTFDIAIAQRFEANYDKFS